MTTLRRLSLFTLFLTSTIFSSPNSFAVQNQPNTDAQKVLNDMLNMKTSDLMAANAIPNYKPVEKLSAIVLGHADNSYSFDVMYFNDKGENISTNTFIVDSEKEKIRVRTLQGHFVDQNLNQILRGDLGKPTSNNTQVNGIEIGKVIIHGFRNWPANIVAQLGIYDHNDGKFQKSGNAVAGMVKFEWHKFPWSSKLRTKFEFAEGLNYASKVPYEEGLNVRKKNDGRDSKLLNYLGVGLAVNLGDLLSDKSQENCYVGGYVYHRSGIFGTVPFFNNVNGGSNYQTLYVECEY